MKTYIPDPQKQEVPEFHLWDKMMVSPATISLRLKEMEKLDDSSDHPLCNDRKRVRKSRNSSRAK